MAGGPIEHEATEWWQDFATVMDDPDAAQVYMLAKGTLIEMKINDEDGKFVEGECERGLWRGLISQLALEWAAMKAGEATG